VVRPFRTADSYGDAGQDCCTVIVSNRRGASTQIWPHNLQCSY